MGRDSDISPKRRISRISQGADQEPVQLHELVKMGKRGRCVNCKGLRFADRPKKRQALTEIAANQGMESTTHQSRYGCKQCDVALCNNKRCFDVFHKES
jgi:hypothetical protein